jgi:hypothetical protein
MSCIFLAGAPLWGATPPSPWGVVVASNRARISDSNAAIGASVYDTDQLATEGPGSLQVRSNNAQLYLAGDTDATVMATGPTPCASLLFGTAMFSTGRGASFGLCFGDARVYPQSAAPVAGQVTVVSPKELLVSSRRGSLTVTVGDETQIVPEGKSYRVFLDTPAGPEDAPGPGPGGHKTLGAIKRARFLMVVSAGTAIITGFAIDEVLESPDMP